MLGIDESNAEPKDLIRDILDLAAIVIAVGLIGLVVAGAVGLPRVLLALAFAFFVPGRAVVSNWPRLAYWSDFGISIVVSLAVLTLAATITLWAHVWHPLGLFEVEAGLCAVALPVSVARRHRRTDDAPAVAEPLAEDADQPAVAEALAHGTDEPAVAEPLAEDADQPVVAEALADSTDEPVEAEALADSTDEPVEADLPAEQLASDLRADAGQPSG